MNCPTYAKEYLVNSQPYSIDTTGLTHVTWVVGQAFATTNYTTRTASGAQYKCVVAHVAASDNEPGVGANFKTFWQLIAEPWVRYIQTIDAVSHTRWFADGSFSPPRVTRDTGQDGAPGTPGVQGPTSSTDGALALFSGTTGNLLKLLNLHFIAGKLGIGTNNPQAPIHVADANPSIRLEDTDGTNQQAEIFGAAGGFYHRARNGASNGVHVFQGYNGSVTQNYGGWTNTGRWGVGTLTPDYPLDVVGAIGFSPGTSVTPAANGDVVADVPDNNTLRWRHKGTDGTVRSGRIRLSESGTKIVPLPTVNRLANSGRFTPAGSYGLSNSLTFEFPSYLSLYNGATVASAGQFIHNNSDNGGSAGNMTATVNDLVNKLKTGTTARRYGSTWMAAEVTAGSGTLASISLSGATYYLAFQNNAVPIIPAMTIGLMARAIDNDCAIIVNAFSTVVKEGVAQSGSTIITPAEGWVHLQQQTDLTNPSSIISYASSNLRMYMKNPGDRLQVALIVLAEGVVDIDPRLGLNANLQEFWV